MVDGGKDNEKLGSITFSQSSQKSTTLFNLATMY